MSVQITTFATIQKLDDDQMIKHLEQHREDVPGYLKTIKEHADYVSSHQGATEFALFALDKEQSKSVENAVSQIFQALRSEPLEVYEQRIMQMPDELLQDEVITCIREGKSFELKTILSVAPERLESFGKETYTKFIDELLQQKKQPVSDEMLYMILENYPIEEEEKYTNFEGKDRNMFGQIVPDTIVHKAIRSGYTHDFPTLINKCPPKYRDDFWKETDSWNKPTLMFIAADCGDVNAIKALMQVCPDTSKDVLWQRNNLKMTPLMYAAGSGNAQAVSTLLQSFPIEYNKAIWGYKKSFEKWEFHYCVDMGNPETIEVIIDACPPDLYEEFWQGTVHQVIGTTNLEGLLAIFRKCPDQFRDKFWEAMSSSRFSILHQAVSSDEIENVEAVLELCPDDYYEKLWVFEDDTPIKVAASNGNIAMIKLLNQKCPQSLQAKMWKKPHDLYLLNQAKNVECLQVLAKECPPEFQSELWCKGILSEGSSNDAAFITALIKNCPKEFQAQIWEGDVLIAAASSAKRAELVPPLINNCPKECRDEFWENVEEALKELLPLNEETLVKLVLDTCPFELSDAFWEKAVQAVRTSHIEGIFAIIRKCPDKLRDEILQKTSSFNLLYKAASSNKIENITAVLELWPEAYSEKLWDAGAESPMMMAASNNNIAMIKLLNQKCPQSLQANLWRNGPYSTILNQATSVEAIEFLARECPPEYQSELWYKGTLGRALSIDAALVEPLIKNCPKEFLVQIWEGNVFFFAAVSEKRAEIVPFLIDNCPEDCRKEFWGNVDEAIDNLLRLKEDVLLKLVIDSCPKKYQDQAWRRKLLSLSVYYEKRAEIVPFLISNCPEDCRKEFWGNLDSAFRGLLQLNEIELAKRVLKACPKEFQAPIWEGYTFSVAASSEKKAEIVPFLINNCPEDYRNRFWPNVLNELYRLLQNNEEALVKLVLDACPENFRTSLHGNRSGQTTLQVAAYNGNPAMITALVNAVPESSRSKLWRSDYNWRGPLYYAVQEGDGRTIEALLSAFPDKREELWSLSKPTIWNSAIRSKNRKALEWLVDNCPEDYLDHHLNHARQEMSSFAELLDQLPERQADRVRNAVDQNGLKYYQYFLIPPFKEITKISTFWPSQLPKPPLLEYMIKQLETQGQGEEELMGQLMGRILERYPAFNPPAAEEKEIRDFIDLAIASHNRELLNMIAHDYKMNQSIPLTSVVLKRILETLGKCKDKREKATAFRLALQTYSYSDFIYSIVDIDKPLRPFPKKAEFLKLTLEEQRALMCRAQVLRQRAALAAAGPILKKAAEEGSYDKDLLMFCLMLYRQTEAEGSKNLQTRLASLFQNEELDLEIRKQAALAFAKVEQDPSNAERKQQLFDAYVKTDQADLKSVFLEALTNYSFTSNEVDTGFASRLATESKIAIDSNLKQSMAYVLSLIPFQDALQASLAIVNSDVWDQIEQKKSLGEQQMIAGGFDIFSYRPLYHDSRVSMKRIIAERFMLSHREDRAQSIEDAYKAYRSQKDDFPEFKGVEDNIRFFVQDEFNTIRARQNSVRYYPQNIYLPPKSVLYRGICAKKGDELAEAAYDDLFVKGTGSADLTYFDTHVEGTWGKVGQVFSSASLGYVMRGYFDNAGILLTIDGEHFNEAFLRRGARIQTEGALHYVSYDTVKHHAITQIFMSTERKERIEKLSLGSCEAKVETDNPKHNKIQKIMGRRLRAPQKKKGSSLKDRITYFDPDQNQFTSHIKERVKQAGLKETNTDAIVEENVKRQIARKLIADELKDSELKECMEFAITQASKPVS